MEKVETRKWVIPSPHQLLARVYLFKWQHAQAIAEAEQARALDPNNR
jgi:hypothetical protein